MLVNTPVGYGDDVISPEKEKPIKKADSAEKASAQVSFELKPIVGLPEGVDPDFYNSLGTLYTVPLKSKPEKLEIPEKVKVSAYAKIEIKGTEFYGAFASDEEGKLNGLYLDVNQDGKLEEKPTKPVYSYTRSNYANARFDITKIKVKNIEYGLFVSYYFTSYINAQTKKETKYTRISYGLVNSFLGNIKIGKNVMKFLVVDKMADGKINLSLRTGDTLFLDKNSDGKFGWGRNGSEIVDAGEIIIDKYIYKFDVDINAKKATLAKEELSYGKLHFNLEGAKDVVMNVSKGVSYNSPTIELKFADGVVNVPTGKYLIREVKFVKDGKNCTVRFFGYSTSDMIEILKEKPCKFAFNFQLIYRLRPYNVRGVEEGKKQFRMYGYVYNRRTIEQKGKKVNIDTRAQLLVNNREFTPPMFTVKDGEGKEIIKETVGKPFC